LGLLKNQSGNTGSIMLLFILRNSTEIKFMGHKVKAQGYGAITHVTL